MMTWLATLSYHNYDIVAPGSPREPSGLANAHRLLKAESKAETTLLVETDTDCVNDEVSCGLFVNKQHLYSSDSYSAMLITLIIMPRFMVLSQSHLTT